MEPGRETKFTVVTPPSLFISASGPSVFLAGSINNGQAEDWQNSVVSVAQSLWLETDLTIYNPRRDQWSEDHENEQMAWTLPLLKTVDYIIMHLTSDGGSPISTLELGMFISDPRLYLSVHDSYTRKETILYHYHHFGHKPVYDSPMHSMQAIKQHWLTTKYLKQ